MGGQMASIDAMDSHRVVSSANLRSTSGVDYRAKKYKLEASSRSCHHFEMDMGNGSTDIKKKPSIDFQVRSSLKQEILQLEKRLKDQLVERHALEKALGYRPPAMDSSNEGMASKTAKQLIREIELLELEVMHLEQYLLLLYRKAFNHEPPPSTMLKKPKQPLISKTQVFQDVARPNDLLIREGQASMSSRMQMSQNLTRTHKETCASTCHDKFGGPGVYRSQSALSYRSARMSPLLENVARALESFHSQPLSFLQDEQNATQGVVSLAEYLGTNVAEHVPETPNKISENMVRCMGAIYCKLADPPLLPHGLSSPTSSFSSASVLSPQYSGDAWSPGYQRESLLDSCLINPFRVDGLKEFSGPYNAMVEVSFICRDHWRLRDVQGLLQNYISLVNQLEFINLRRMKNEEKLSFWINVHNAMAMHAYLEHGIPESNTKKQSILSKATYVIGGRSVSASVIRGSILGCHMHCHRQWVRLLLSARMKFKSKDEWQAYTLERSEPLLHFALCLGSHSDPAVRIYIPKKLSQQLESAKEEYIRASVGIRNDQKVVLPRIIDSFAKDKGLSSQGLMEMIEMYLPEPLRTAVRRCQQGRSHKIIDWVPHDFSFRYLLSKELTTSVEPDLFRR